MTNTIKRNNWSRFCRRFSTTNQFCEAEVQLMGSTAEPGEATRRFSFMGMALKKEGRLIDGVQLFGATADAQPVAAPLVTITNPKEIMVERDQDGADRRLTIRSADGMEATVVIHDSSDSDSRRELVERTAYSVYESRSHSHGDDQQDWLEAERRLNQAASVFV
ncbi:MAG: DUF2934 domain-containing protein [candidate division Zixibacteria bacterium]|nr:DUF2934 domain-containing protein [candidate division Zixibacteria bacterium]